MNEMKLYTIEELKGMFDSYTDQIKYWMSVCDHIREECEMYKSESQLYRDAYEKIGACDIGNFLALCSSAKEDLEALDWIEKKFYKQPWKVTGHLTGHWTVRESIKWILEHHEDYPMPADDLGRLNQVVHFVEENKRTGPL